jgi:ssDNA-binding Zn-finger/Zn-ribbon topoisomerase 1
MTTDVRCSKCGSEMIIRTVKKVANIGERFYVCVYYPECKGKIEVE